MTATLTTEPQARYADPADPAIPRHPKTPEEAVAFLRWCDAQRTENGLSRYTNNFPADLAFDLQEKTAIARIAYREIDREILPNDEDQLSALLAACRILTETVEWTLEELAVLQGRADTVRLLGFRRACLVEFRRGATLETVTAEAARIERREEKERERREEVTP
jgi:hypothetical protein